MKYTIELTEKQLSIVQNALEEWFRLRMGQDMDFCDDLAKMNADLSPDNPQHKQIFGYYISRRDHMREIMKAFFRIAFEPFGYLTEKTKDMLIAETIWDAIRCARGQSRWGKPLALGGEPCPKIEKEKKICKFCGEVDYSTAYTSDPPQYKCEKYGCLVRTTDTCKGEQNAQKQKEGKEA